MRPIAVIATLAALGALALALASATPTAADTWVPGFAGDFDPAWSPDGRRLAFTTTERGRYEIAVADARGRGRRYVASGAQPAWSPDGALAFVESGDVFVLRDGEARNVTRTVDDWEASPAWSPDGSRIAFVAAPARGGDSELFVINADGTARRQLTDNDYGEASPAWAPNGAVLGFTRVQSGEDLRLVLPRLFVGALLRSDVRFLRLADGADGPLVSDVPEPRLEADVAWAPDGQTIAFTRYRARSARIAIKTVGRRGTREIVDGAEPSWAPDSRQIVFAARLPSAVTRATGADASALYVANADGTGKTRLTGPSISSWTADPSCTIAGTPRADRIRGTARRDVICALAGADRVRAGDGDDTVSGGAGDDRIDVRDRTRDAVSCGRGRDRVVADRRDAVARDCERVRRR